MRQIKFRVWDKTEKKMTFGGSFHTLELDGVDQEWFGMQTPHPDDCEIMQYTGIKDKNGKEIYEGDVVTCCGGYDYPEGSSAPCEDPREVKFDDGKWVVHCPNCDDWEPLFEWDINEIIGNIYENPELLKV